MKESLAETWLLLNLQNAASLEGTPSDVLLRPHGLRFLKALTEISYFGIYGSVCTSDHFILSIREMLTPFVQHPNFFSFMRFNTDCSSLFLSLCDVGFRLDLLDGAATSNIQKLCEILSETGPERVPFRQLDLLHGLDNLGYPIDVSLREMALKTGCFANTKRLQNLTSADGYALTHNIFYLTDFGRSPQCVDPQLLPDVQQALQHLSAIAVSEQNMDLLSEYLLCIGYLNLVDEGTRENCRLLSAFQQRDGSWLGPVEMGSALKKLEVPLQLHPFYSNYHTTLLAWQAQKVIAGIGTLRTREARPLCQPFQPTHWTDIINEIRLISSSGEMSSDFSFVIWVANRLGFGFQQEIDELRVELFKIKSWEGLPSVENLRLVAGLACSQPDDPCGHDEPRVETCYDIWEVAHVLARKNRDQSLPRLLKNRLSVESQRNRGAYVRLLALGVIFDIFPIISLENELAYVETLYSPSGEFFWRRRVSPDSTNTAIIGKLLLKAFHEPPTNLRTTVRNSPREESYPKPGQLPVI
jgi:hypothetical protein